MTILAMSISERRAKRKTTTIPGVSKSELPASTGLATEGGTSVTDDSTDDGEPE
jgi:hypothetical protein